MSGVRMQILKLSKPGSLGLVNRQIIKFCDSSTVQWKQVQALSDERENKGSEWVCYIKHIATRWDEATTQHTQKKLEKYL